MRKLEFPYGRGVCTVEIPESPRHMVLSPQEEAAPGDGRALVRQALEHPIQSPSLRELTRTAKKITIITNDNTRPMPSRITLPEILRHFYYPERYYDIIILIATGLHRAMTRAEQEEQYGAAFCRTHRILCHNASDPAQNVRVGRLSSGNTLYIDRAAAESDLVISEGFIEPHFFAGFSGGRKSILPGIAGEPSILFNHSPQNIANANAAQGILCHNPIHEDCQEAAAMAGLRFILNVTLDRHKQITAAFAGDPEAAFLQGVDYVRQRMTVPACLSDIVVTSNTGYPLDRNLYQVVKGIDTAAKVVRPGGVIIAVAQCADGIGHDTFRDLICRYGTVEELCAGCNAVPAERDKWQVQVFAKARQKARVILVNDTIPQEQLRPLFLERAPDIPTAIAMAKAWVGPDPFITYMPEGPVIIPQLPADPKPSHT